MQDTKREISKRGSEEVLGKFHCLSQLIAATVLLPLYAISRVKLEAGKNEDFYRKVIANALKYYIDNIKGKV
jgi:hypothetical protein